MLLLAPSSTNHHFHVSGKYPITEVDLDEVYCEGNEQTFNKLQQACNKAQFFPYVHSLIQLKSQKKPKQTPKTKTTLCTFPA